MFKAVTKDVNILRSSLDSISSLITEGSFKINNNGLSLIAMDPASVAMIIYNLLSTAFDKFEVSEEMIISFNIPKFVSILKRAGTKDIVTIETDGTSLKIIMEGDTNRVFVLPLIELKEKEQKIPDLDFKSNIEFNAATLKSAIKDVSMISDCVQFEAGEGFIISASCDGSKVETKISTAKVEGSAKSKYSVEYLDKMIGLAKVADTLKIQFSDDYPLKLDFKALDKLHLSFILAPRVDND